MRENVGAKKMSTYPLSESQAKRFCQWYDDRGLKQEIPPFFLQMAAVSTDDTGVVDDGLSYEEDDGDVHMA